MSRRRKNTSIGAELLDARAALKLAVNRLARIESLPAFFDETKNATGHAGVGLEQIAALNGDAAALVVQCRAEYRVNRGGAS